jgi:hypothetical protein
MELSKIILDLRRDTRTTTTRVDRGARAAVLGALGVVLLFAGGAFAIESSDSVAGSWHLDPSGDHERQRLEAIDDATDHLRSMQRGRARSRLAERTTPPERLTIELAGSKVMIASGGRELELELGGSPIEVSGDQGKALLSATTEGDELIVTADGGKGKRTTRYRANGDRLSVEVTMTAAMLSAPLTYSTTYTRAE